MMNKELLPQRMKLRRNEMELSQQEMAKRIGISVSHYAAIEAGKSFPCVPTLLKIAAGMNVKIAWLLGESKQPSQTEELARRMRIRREELGLTQLGVAIKLGMSDDTYGNYERGRNLPPARILARIAKVLRTTPEYLFGTEPELEPQPEPQPEPQWVIELGAEPEPVREYNDSWADMDVGIDYDLANVTDWSY